MYYYSSEITTFLLVFPTSLKFYASLVHKTEYQAMDKAYICVEKYSLFLALKVSVREFKWLVTEKKATILILPQTIGSFKDQFCWKAKFLAPCVTCVQFHTAPWRSLGLLVVHNLSLSSFPTLTPRGWESTSSLIAHPVVNS